MLNHRSLRGWRYLETQECSEISRRGNCQAVRVDMPECAGLDGEQESALLIIISRLDS